MPFRISLLTLTLALLPTASLHAQESVPSSPEALRDSIATVLGSTGAPGAAVVLFSADSIRWEGYFGLADRAATRPVTDKTVFRVGSISKSVVSTAALLLNEEGRLDLRTPVRELAPDVEV
jgi:CubicO group peptidase (beta-lactamase class C family)